MDFTWIHGVAAAALTINALSLASVIWRLSRLSRPRIANEAVATIILPVTGPVPNLEMLIGALNIQTLQPRRLIATIESETDPAWARVREISPMARFPIELVAGGEATDQAQKCRNQQAALDLVDARDQVIVLMDADILPQPWWLSALVSPLMDGAADLVTGHRWQQPVAPRLGAHLVTAIDRAVTLLPRFDWDTGSAVWGGSVAISRDAADRMQLRAALARTVSDDLAIASAARASRLRILTRGALLIPSPTSLDLPSAFRFGARQYRIGHLYRPWLWRLALAVIALRLAAWLVLIGQTLLFGTFWPALVALAFLAAVKQTLVGEIASRVSMPDPTAVRLVQILLGPLQVVVDLFHIGILVAAARTSPLAWSHVVYEITAPDEIKVTRRLPFGRV